jgi:outer membrane biosynthesis protein TonB
MCRSKMCRRKARLRPVSALPRIRPSRRSREVVTAHVGTAAPAAQRSAAPPARSIPQDITAPAQTLAAARKTNQTAAIIHHPVTPAPKISAAVAESPRVQISGRPQKLVYPVCPETQARGKVSLQAVVEYDGAVSRVRVLTGDRTLAAAAIEAVRQWRFEPFSGAAPHLERGRCRQLPHLRAPFTLSGYPVRSQTSHTWQLLCMSPGSKPASRLLLTLNPF